MEIILCFQSDPKETSALQNVKTLQPKNVSINESQWEHSSKTLKNEGNNRSELDVKHVGLREMEPPVN